METITPSLTATEAKALAKEAYLFGLPLFFIEKQFDNNTYTNSLQKAKAQVNQFLYYRAFVDASDKYIFKTVNITNMLYDASFD